MGIKDPILDVMHRLEAIDVTNGDGKTIKLYTRIWNNQMQLTQNGQLYDYPKPAAFVETLVPMFWEVMSGGMGVRNSEIGFNIHLIHEFYNQDGTFEQNLPVFDLRDKVLIQLSGFQPMGCSGLMCIREEQDYDHNNLYHYIMGFIADYIEAINPDCGGHIIKDPPTQLDLSGVQFAEGIAEDGTVISSSNVLSCLPYRIPK